MNNNVLNVQCFDALIQFSRRHFSVLYIYRADLATVDIILLPISYIKLNTSCFVFHRLADGFTKMKRLGWRQLNVDFSFIHAFVMRVICHLSYFRIIFFSNSCFFRMSLPFSNKGFLKLSVSSLIYLRKSKALIEF